MSERAAWRSLTIVETAFRDIHPNEEPAGSCVLPAGSSSTGIVVGYWAQVWPPATTTGPGLLPVVLSPTWPNALYPQQRATPLWFTPQVW